MVLVREVSDDDRSADDASAPRWPPVGARPPEGAGTRGVREKEKVGEKESDIKTRTTKGRYARGDTIATGNPNHMRGEDA